MTKRVKDWFPEREFDPTDSNVCGDMMHNINKALDIVVKFGGLRGLDEKTMIIDKMCRELLDEDQYKAFLAYVDTIESTIKE